MGNVEGEELRHTSLRDIFCVLTALCILLSISSAEAIEQEKYQTAAILQSPQPESYSEFGWSVAIDEAIIVVGEPWATEDGKCMAGRAHMFDSEGNLLMTLQSPEPEQNAWFGWTVSVSGDTVVVGEPQADATGISNAGKAHVFSSDGRHLKTLRSPEPEANAWFGNSVAVSGEKVVIGEFRAKADGKYHAGRAHILDRNGTLLKTIQSPGPEENAWFGRSVAISGDIIAVGEPQADVEGVSDSGRAHTFDSDGNLLATLRAPQPQAYTEYGGVHGTTRTRLVAVSGEIIVLGERGADVDGNSKAGRAYIFDAEGNLVKTLQSPEPEANAEFGGEVAVSEDIIAVGEYNADVEVLNEGKAFMFDSEGNLLSTLQSPEPRIGAKFGWSVALSKGIALVGEPEATVEGHSKAGKVYLMRTDVAVFVLSDLTIVPDAVNEGGTVKISVKVSNTGRRSGSYGVAMKINDAVDGEKTVTLDPDESETVSFEVTATEKGTFTVQVNDMGGSYTVRSREEKPPGGIPIFIYGLVIMVLAAGALFWFSRRSRL